LGVVERVPRRLLVAGTALCVVAFIASIVTVIVVRHRDVGASPATVIGDPTSATVPTTALATAPATVAVQRVFPVVPLPGSQVTYDHTHHDYPATDILTDCGGTYLAPISGVVNNVNRVDTWDPTTDLGEARGGLSVAIVGDDGVRYYGSHFKSINDNLEPGVRVKAGDPIAIVGRTGDASACHVHFGLSPLCSDGDWFIRRGVIWPWPYLDSWRSGGNAAPGPEIQQWLAENNGCPTKPSVDP